MTAGLLRKVVDIAWGRALEDESVPSSHIVNEIVAKAQADTGSPHVSDDMLRSFIEAMMPDRIQGFSTRDANGVWGPPHYIRDVWNIPDEQEIWRGDDHAEMMERCEMERVRLGLLAALGHGQGTSTKQED